MIYTVGGDLVANLACSVINTGTPQHLAWNPAGSHLACWVSKPPAITVFQTHTWTQVCDANIIVTACRWAERGW